MCITLLNNVYIAAILSKVHALPFRIKEMILCRSVPLWSAPVRQPMIYSSTWYHSLSSVYPYSCTASFPLFIISVCEISVLEQITLCFYITTCRYLWIRIPIQVMIFVTWGEKKIDLCYNSVHGATVWNSVPLYNSSERPQQHTWRSWYEITET